LNIQANIASTKRDIETEVDRLTADVLSTGKVSAEAGREIADKADELKKSVDADSESLIGKFKNYTLTLKKYTSALSDNKESLESLVKI
jgi:hypothetical protein